MAPEPAETEPAGTAVDAASVAAIAQCLCRDRVDLRRLWRSIEQRRRRGQLHDRLLARFQRQVEQSAAARQKRLDGLPKPAGAADLPISEKRDAIARAIAEHQVVVVCGQTGSGKSTQLPAICLEAGRGVDGVIGHTQPRRIAARSIAARLAEELGRPLGREVGYKVRFNDRTSGDGYIKVMTDGILLAETQHDRMLSAYDTIIIDEAHERGLNIDFLLGYLHQLLPQRPDLKLIVTSATIDPDRFSRHFGDCPAIEVSGRAHPVELRYRPLRTDDPDEQDREMLEGIVDAVDELAREGRAGDEDILVFLPGEREIREAAEALRKHHPPRTEILPLFARLSAEQQNRIFRPHPGRRIVLATNVAETSLTVPGIRHVVDTGVARISRYSPRAKVQRLPIEAISQASAEQRKGRCGREAPGICIRLYDEKDFNAREPFTPPEIQRTNLANVVLQMKTLGLGEIEDFPFLDPPKPAMVREGYRTLHEIGAVDEKNALTDPGRELARLPVDPRLGRMILSARAENCLSEILIIAAAMSIQDPRQRPADAQAEADRAHAAFLDEDSDFFTLLNLWRFYHEQRRKLSHNQLRKCCRQNYLSHVRMREWHDVHAQLKDLVTTRGTHLNIEPAERDAVHRAILSGFLSHIGRLGEGHAYSGAGGRQFHIFPGSGVFKRKPKWVVAAELVETTRLYARMVARIQPQWLEQLAPHLIKRSYSNPRWNPRSGHVQADETVSLYGLPIIIGRTVHYGPVNPDESRRLFIHHALVLGEWRSRAPFFDHNQRLKAQVEALEAKLRRRDLLAGEDARFAFYDSRIPADIHNGPAFDRWRRRAERKHAKLLFMDLTDLMPDEASLLHPGLTAGSAMRAPSDAKGDPEAGSSDGESAATDEATVFRHIDALLPDELDLGSGGFPLTYIYDPADPADGITVTVPVEAFNLLAPQRLSWLVPGRVREKAVELVRNLPRQHRRNFVPVPDTVDAILPQLAEPRGSLAEALMGALTSRTGVKVPLAAWKEGDLPAHLRMNVRVVDDQGHILAEGRDLDTLREQLGDRVQQSLARLGAVRFDQEGLVSWSFEDLPERVDQDHGGVRLQAFPALVDEGKTVALRLAESPAAAARLSRGGQRRLFMLQVREELRHQKRSIEGLDQMRMQYRALRKGEDLAEQLVDLIADRAFFADEGLVRTRAGFLSRCERAWDRLAAARGEVCHLVRQLLATAQAAVLKLEGDAPWPESAAASLADVRQQMQSLLDGRFLLEVDYAWLRHYPRYFMGLQHRLDKLRGGGAGRDREALVTLTPYWQAWRMQKQQHDQRGVIDPELEAYRWMIEEYRISLFAQQLGTAIPVSQKRLDRQWGRVQP